MTGPSSRRERSRCRWCGRPCCTGSSSPTRCTCGTGGCWPSRSPTAARAFPPSCARRMEKPPPKPVRSPSPSFADPLPPDPAEADAEAGAAVRHDPAVLEGVRGRVPLRGPRVELERRPAGHGPDDHQGPRLPRPCRLGGRRPANRRLRADVARPGHRLPDRRRRRRVDAHRPPSPTARRRASRATSTCRASPRCPTPSSRTSTSPACGRSSSPTTTSPPPASRASAARSTSSRAGTT